MGTALRPARSHPGLPGYEGALCPAGPAAWAFPSPASKGVPFPRALWGTTKQRGDGVVPAPQGTGDPHGDPCVPDR